MGHLFPVEAGDHVPPLRHGLLIGAAVEGPRAELVPGDGRMPPRRGGNVHLRQEGQGQPRPVVDAHGLPPPTALPQALRGDDLPPGRRRPPGRDRRGSPPPAPPRPAAAPPIGARAPDADQANHTSWSILLYARPERFFSPSPPLKCSTGAPPSRPSARRVCTRPSRRVTRTVSRSGISTAATMAFSS